MANSLSDLTDNLAEANENSKKRFKNAFKLSDNLINIYFVIQKNLNPYGSVDIWEKV